MKKTFLPVFGTLALLLCACGTEPYYEMAYRAIDKLQTLIVNPGTIFIKHVFHGTPPAGDYGELILVLYSSINEESTRANSYFGYESDELYYVGLDAVTLYDYRDYYFQLDTDRVNDHYGYHL
ncbi:MAG: hypothetical protein WC399_04240 [Bacilli bacterium]|jgi:hypothetical protein